MSPERSVTYLSERTQQFRQAQTALEPSRKRLASLIRAGHQLIREGMALVLDAFLSTRAIREASAGNSDPLAPSVERDVTLA